MAGGPHPGERRGGAQRRVRDGLVSGRRPVRRAPAARPAHRQPDQPVLGQLLPESLRPFRQARAALPGLPALRRRFPALCRRQGDALGLAGGGRRAAGPAAPDHPSRRPSPAGDRGHSLPGLCRLSRPPPAQAAQGGPLPAALRALVARLGRRAAAGARRPPRRGAGPTTPATATPSGCARRCWAALSFPAHQARGEPSDFSFETWKQAATDKLQSLGSRLERLKAQGGPYPALRHPLRAEPLAADGGSAIGQLLPAVDGPGRRRGRRGRRTSSPSRYSGGRIRAARSTRKIVAAWVADGAAANPDLRQAVDSILERLEAVQTLQAALVRDDRQWFVDTLRAEMAQLGNLPASRRR